MKITFHCRKCWKSYFIIFFIKGFKRCLFKSFISTQRFFLFNLFHFYGRLQVCTRQGAHCSYTMTVRKALLPRCMCAQKSRVGSILFEESTKMSKYVLVTGGNSGIGLALCKILIKDHGCHVFLESRNIWKGIDIHFLTRKYKWNNSFCFFRSGCFENYCQ